jgi:hypothetical protein
MFEVTAISVATDPVYRIRPVALRPQPASVAEVPQRAEAPQGSVFSNPAAVLQIGSQARDLARKVTEQRREQEPPPQPSTERHSLADAARSAAQALWANEDALDQDDDSESGGDNQSEGSQQGAVPEKKLSAEERRQIEELKKRDREVRAEQQAQKSTGGQVTGAARYEYRMGPDGRLYAVEGSIAIDATPVNNDPEATLRKAEAAQRAALAPSEPSMADRQIAAQAERLAQRALAELAARRYAEQQGVDNGPFEPPPPAGSDSVAPPPALQTQIPPPATDEPAADESPAEDSERATYNGLRLVA